MPDDYRLEVVDHGEARRDLTFTRGQCQYCPYVAQRTYAGYAEASVIQHLRDKHKIPNPTRNLRKKIPVAEPTL